MMEFRFDSPAGNGWKEGLLRDPIAILTGDLSLNTETILNFFRQYGGNFIAGYITYDYGRDQLRVTGNQPDLMNIPAVMFAAYPAIMESGIEIPKIQSIQRPVFKSLISRDSYLRAVHTILERIWEGEFYQANYTHFLKACWEGDGQALYEYLLQQNTVGYAVRLRTDDFTVMSFSPECFLRFRGRQVITEPIKGTVARLDDSRNEETELLKSAKEAAELDMITDLLRNDLGKVCVPGSVKVVRHRALLKLEKLWHTVTAIEGILTEESPVAAVISCLPGGSISGCPKKRAVEEIQQLEKYARGLYTGTIGLQYPNGDSDWSIAIRTIYQKEQSLILGVGGGITIDSNPEAEYDESLAKARSLGEIQPC